MCISSNQLLHIRRTISDTIKQDAFTRIGIFNQLQQNQILCSTNTAYVNESIGLAIRREIEQQLAPWIRAMTTAVKLRNASKSATRPEDEEREDREKITDYNIFDERSDHSSEDEGPTNVRVTIPSRHRETTDLIFSQEQLDEYISDDFFLTEENTNPTTIGLSLSCPKMTHHAYNGFAFEARHTV